MDILSISLRRGYLSVNETMPDVNMNMNPTFLNEDASLCANTILILANLLERRLARKSFL